jgi:nucleotide-binding universal stress UspA family protein
MFTRLLVPLDGSEFAEAALPLAAAVSRGAGAALELVSAIDASPPPPVPGVEGAALPVQPDPLSAVPETAGGLRESLRAERADYLRDVARRLREQAGAEAEVTLLDGRPDRVVMERVAARGVGLVVMATHGRGPMERAWLGSVADSLARQLPIPVLLVRPAEGERPQLTATVTVRRVLVPLDGSPLAEAALEPAAHLASALAAPLALLRVISARGHLESPYIPHAAQAYREQIEADRHEAAAYLDDIAGRLREAGTEVTDCLVEEGSAARTILAAPDADGAGDAGGADVIAMATHGRGGLRRLVLGSVSDKVLRAALGPVLLVRPPED